MKVLVLSLSTGAGHNSCANAIVDCFRKKNVQCDFLDAYKYISPLLDKTVTKGYRITSEHLSKGFGFVYGLQEKPKTDGEAAIAVITNSPFATKLLQYINEYKPDAIITTHVFVGLMLEALKRRKELSVPCIGVITDYTIHPFFDCLHSFDYIVLANELLKDRARRKGLDEKVLLSFGIPIRSQFTEPMDRETALEKLGIKTGKPIILLMNGGYGIGRLDKMVKALDSAQGDFEMMTVCGKNERVKAQIDELETTHKLYNYGFCTNMDVIMSACYAIVSKPGGLTTSEALAKELPMLIINPIPGQEERNAEFLLNTGCAMRVTKTFPLEEAAYFLLHSKERAAQMKQSIAAIKKPNATQELCDFTIDLIK